MLKTLRFKLLFSFVILSLLSIVLISAAFRFAFDDCFAIYLENKKNDDVQQLIEQVKLKAGNIEKLQSDKELLTLLSYQAMSEGLFYKFYNQHGQLVLDSTHLIGKLADLAKDGGEELNIEGLKFVNETHELRDGNRLLGQLVVQYRLGYQQGEFQFKKRLDYYILIAEGTMLVLAILFSFFISKKLTSGLKQMSDVAQELRHHNMDARMPLDHFTGEIQEVAASFNELAESLSYQEKLRKQFSTDLAHEFRTPITILQSQLEAFQDGILEPTPDRLKQCHIELMRLVRLVDDLEKLMVAENPKLQLNIVELNVQDELNSLKEYYTPISQGKGISLIVHELTEPLFLMADSDRCKQILANLLDNALKYTPEDGVITIGAYASDKMVHIYVKDTGVGIPSEDLPHVFERFYRGDKSRNRKTGGVGIGLSIVKALVHVQKGTIDIKSERGKGTKVEVSFLASRKE